MSFEVSFSFDKELEKLKQKNLELTINIKDCIKSFENYNNELKYFAEELKKIK